MLDLMAAWKFFLFFFFSWYLYDAFLPAEENEGVLRPRDEAAVGDSPPVPLRLRHERDRLLIFQIEDLGEPLPRISHCG